MTAMQFATINGVTLHYRIDGQNAGMPLVLVNALGWDMRLWDAVVPHLTPHHRVLRYDQRGHGLSDCPPAPYTISDLARDLAGLLVHLHIERAILAGISVGGLVALQTALIAPQRVKALILCDTAAKIGTADYWTQRIDTLRAHGMAHLADTIISRWFAPGFVQPGSAVYRGFYNLLMRAPLEGYIATCAALRDADLRADVGQLNSPALVLCGTEDAATPPDMARGLAESLPDAQFQLIAGAGHTPPVEQPEQMAGIMLQFLREQAHE